MDRARVSPENLRDALHSEIRGLKSGVEWVRWLDAAVALRNYSFRNVVLITLQMPYATFHYRVQYHQVVPNDDWKIIRPQGYERLVLSACHPLYSSSHRWIVYARGMSATLKGGATVSLRG